MKTPVGASLALAACLAAGPAAAQTCGDYVREAPEQCDDGNTRDLDGCDANCKFEQSVRINDLRFQRTVGINTCPATRFGSAFTSGAQDSTNDGIINSIGAGATSIVFRMGGLDDLSGTNDAAVSVGVLSGRVLTKVEPPYDGNTNDRDWWYGIDKNVLDSQRQPLYVLPGSITNRVVTAGPGTAALSLVLSGSATSFKLTNMTIRMTNQSATSAPAASATTDPPGHLPIEHLDPALTSYQTAGAPVVPGLAPQGILCGNISALSLAQTVIPTVLRGATCDNQFDATNSLLDAFAAGCPSFINVTQPDEQDSSAPAVGAGPPYSFSVDAGFHVTGCKDSAAADVDLAACLADAAFSSFWRFSVGRVIASEDLVLRDSFETGDLSAWTASSTDGGDLRVDPSAQIGPGTIPNGLLGTVNDTTPLYVEDSTPADEQRYRARFDFDPTGFDPGEINNKRRVRLFIAFEDSPRRLVAIILRRLNGQYAIQARTRLDDNTQANTVFTDINAGPHRIEFDWLHASAPGATDGQFRLWIDDVLVDTLTGLANSASTVDFVRLGALAVKVGANGPLKWDHFESRRMGKMELQ